MVNLTNYNQKEVASVTASTCASTLGITQGSFGNGSFFASNCPAAPKANFTYTEPMWVAVFATSGAIAGMFILWDLYKRLRERKYYGAPGDMTIHSSDWSEPAPSEEKKARALSEKHNAPGPVEDEKVDSDDIIGSNGVTKIDNDTASVASSSDVDIEEAGKATGLTFTAKGYRQDWFGSAMLALTVLVSLGLQAYLFVITLDYYGLLLPLDYSSATRGDELYGLYLGSSTLSLQAFMSVFYINAAWLIGLAILRYRIRNYFRIRVEPTKATHIQVERYLEKIKMLGDDGGTFKWLDNLTEAIRRGCRWDYNITTAPIQYTKLGRPFFVYQCTRYVYDEVKKTYTPYGFELGATHAQLLEHVGGLKEEEAANRLELLGPNFIEVKVPNFFQAMFNEFMGFFYLYQFIVLWLFYYWAYYYIGLVDFGVIVLSAIVKVVIRLRSETRIKHMAEHETETLVLRDGEWKAMSTSKLVEGDVIAIRDEDKMTVDAVILSGDVVVDESSLTGEALPVRKFAIKNDGGLFDFNHGRMNALFAGTTVSQAMPLDAKVGKVTALVVRTGTKTDKGALVTKILFPNPTSFVFDEQLRVAFALLACEALLVFALAMWWQSRGGISGWLYGMFCLCQVISPLIPASLVVGQSMGAAALRRRKVYCVDLPRILLAAKTKIFCFDKTGTLTKEGLEFFGALPISQVDTVNEKSDVSKPAFGEQKGSIADLPRIIRFGLATCHTVTNLNGQFIGNPVDIEQFTATKWKLEKAAHEDYLDTLVPQDDPKDTAPIHVLKRFEFIHARQSMSVAVLDTTDNHVHVFVKGSFEKVKEISNAESVPENYDVTANALAKEGCYTLALAHADLGEIDITTLRGVTREQLERNVNVVSLIMFKNFLKDDTASALQELKNGHVRSVMITGDNVYTGIYIARQCNMIEPGNRVLLADLNKGTGQVMWTDTETGEAVDVDEILDTKRTKPVELAVSGKAFDILTIEGQMRKYLLDTRVFGRMTPDQKVDCVKLHMERTITSMCGDGGNDCGALRAAHAGIALSEAEASIVSPFSTNFRSIWSCVNLLIQGRAALTTSFAGYKFLIMYGQIVQILKTISLYYSLGLTQNTWIMVDAFIAVGCTWAISQARATDRLAPYRPTARILGPEVLASLLGAFCINWAFQLGAFKGLLYSQDFFRCHEWDASSANLAAWWLLGDNYETETLTLIGLPQFVGAAFVFNFGFLYRKSFFHNYTLMIIVCVFLAILYYFLLADPNPFACMFRINCGDPDVLVAMGYTRPYWYIEPYNNLIRHNVYPKVFRIKLFFMSIGNLLTLIIWEKVVVLGPVRTYLRKKYPLRRQTVKL
ncbi:hypothetical protein BZG36_01004 [Bifiguratus adelaidae]|uniref:Cation-transporting P-type ATPase N-terminal domain-containing protein n=1 Tax=Bifiguratus adelaidae TaxID=1938954 RepID=A0A261Y6H7_9FUNG|nr:hypothetical protein BZG36_01004 [Bifiguratus adelaidae]